MKITTLVMGTLVFLGVSGATLLAAQHKKSPQTSPAEAANQATVAWQPSFEAALAQAKTSGQIVMVDFGAKWCGACKVMNEQTYPDASVIAESKGFVMVKVDVDARPNIAERYGISSLPTTGWLHSDGKPIAGTVGALEPRDLVAAMREATKRAQKNTK